MMILMLRSRWDRSRSSSRTGFPSCLLSESIQACSFRSGGSVPFIEATVVRMGVGSITLERVSLLTGSVPLDKRPGAQTDLNT